jgi:hypothetical protein
MPTVTLFWDDGGHSQFDFRETVFLENGIARVDGRRYTGVEAIRVQAESC